MEYFTPEGCFIAENWGLSTGEKAVSIARARVKPGVTTKPHHLKASKEIYVIVKGKGQIHVGDLKPEEVAEGDIIAIPAGVSQKIRNVGESDLIFYCVCTPSFQEDDYVNEDPGSGAPSKS
jgi:mannose-6-phosphate isomerase-like protein (cupin superfamily)